jgi:hypothetical protein
VHQVSGMSECEEDPRDFNNYCDDSDPVVSQAPVVPFASIYVCNGGVAIPANCNRPTISTNRSALVPTLPPTEKENDQAQNNQADCENEAVHDSK